jgi:sarcosine oxidase subunit alpha
VPRRLRPLSHPAEITHDGTTLPAERGEPLAFALLAAGRLPIARSPKLHRPRGPYCLRGGCDGCLARVDGVPNVMTCLSRTRGGERIETQNVLGTRGVDALRAADFLFPHGIDHHRLFAGVRGVSGVVQSFARRVAGLGKLPTVTEPVRPAERRSVDVLVVGGGAAGLAAAAELGTASLCVTDAPSFGGSRAVVSAETLAPLLARARHAKAALFESTTVVGLYREPESSEGRLHALLVGDAGAMLVDARAVIVAAGTHDPVLAFENNDLPGVYSARAGLALYRAGITPGERVVVIGRGRYAKAFGAAAGDIDVTAVDSDRVVRAVGRSNVSGVVVREGDGEKRLRADALLIDGPAPPAHELVLQAGGRVRFDPERGYRVETDADGRCAPGLWAAGSVVASEGDSSEAGAAVAEAVRAALRS